jgi:FixJ family two-component response regulator
MDPLSGARVRLISPAVVSDISCGRAHEMNDVPPTIHVVDDDAGFRTAVTRLLSASGYTVTQHESGRQLLEGPPLTVPGCILLDLQMADLGGLELQDRLRATGQLLPVIFLTGHGDIPSSVRAIKSGAHDFLSKPVSKDILLNAVARAVAASRDMYEHDSRIKALRALIATLTPREMTVFSLVVRGRLNKQIAYTLGTSIRTVKAHRSSIMRKLQVRSVAEAVTMAERLGLLDSPAEEPGQRDR